MDLDLPEKRPRLSGVPDLDELPQGFLFPPDHLFRGGPAQNLSISTLPAKTVDPNRISFREIFAFPGTMNLSSQVRASMHPPATACPFTAAR